MSEHDAVSTGIAGAELFSRHPAAASVSSARARTAAFTAASFAATSPESDYWTLVQTRPPPNATPVGDPPTEIRSVLLVEGSIRTTEPSSLAAQTAPAPTAVAIDRPGVGCFAWTTSCVGSICQILRPSKSGSQTLPSPTVTSGPEVGSSIFACRRKVVGASRNTPSSLVQSEWNPYANGPQTVVRPGTSVGESGSIREIARKLPPQIVSAP